jgi:hypothetical protein
MSDTEEPGLLTVPDKLLDPNPTGELPTDDFEDDAPPNSPPPTDDFEDHPDRIYRRRRNTNRLK